MTPDLHAYLQNMSVQRGMVGQIFWRFSKWDAMASDSDISYTLKPICWEDVSPKP